jgi:hypothetical protein
MGIRHDTDVALRDSSLDVSEHRKPRQCGRHRDCVMAQLLLKSLTINILCPNLANHSTLENSLLGHMTVSVGSVWIRKLGPMHMTRDPSIAQGPLTIVSLILGSAISPTQCHECCCCI